MANCLYVKTFSFLDIKMPVKKIHTTISSAILILLKIEFVCKKRDKMITYWQWINLQSVTPNSRPHLFMFPIVGIRIGLMVVGQTVIPVNIKRLVLVYTMINVRRLLKGKILRQRFPSIWLSYFPDHYFLPLLNGMVSGPFRGSVTVTRDDFMTKMLHCVISERRSRARSAANFALL